MIPSNILRAISQVFPLIKGGQGDSVNNTVNFFQDKSPQDASKCGSGKVDNTTSLHTKLFVKPDNNHVLAPFII